MIIVKKQSIVIIILICNQFKLCVYRSEHKTTPKKTPMRWEYFFFNLIKYLYDSQVVVFGISAQIKDVPLHIQCGCLKLK